MNKNNKKAIGTLAMAVIGLVQAKAQGVQGITAAESSLIGYVDPVASLCLVIGAVVGIIGGGRGYIKLDSGLVLGGVIGSFTNMVFGGLLTIGTIIGGLYFTSLQQKKGLHNKTRNQGVFLHPTDLK